MQCMVTRLVITRQSGGVSSLQPGTFKPCIGNCDDPKTIARFVTCPSRSSSNTLC